MENGGSLRDQGHSHHGENEHKQTVGEICAINAACRGNGALLNVLFDTFDTNVFGNTIADLLGTYRYLVTDPKQLKTYNTITNVEDMPKCTEIIKKSFWLYILQHQQVILMLLSHY